MTPARAALYWAAVLLLVPALAAFAVALRAYRLESASLRATGRVPAERPKLAELESLEPVEVRGREGAVHGFHLASRNGAMVVLLHGLGGSRGELLPQARALARAGYGLLWPDLPGHGESAGRRAHGTADVAVVRAAVDAAAARGGWQRLFVYGFSFGGCVALAFASGEPRVAAVAVEGTPPDLERQLAFEYRKGGLPALWGARLADRNAGLDFDYYRPAAAIRALAPRPVLVIAGTADTTVDVAQARALFEAASEPRELWIVEGAEHGQAARVQPEEYARRLVGFFDRHLAPSR
jgi:alpha-beta hydrolase superfamily lysophospholipase